MIEDLTGVTTWDRIVRKKIRRKEKNLREAFYQFKLFQYWLTNIICCDWRKKYIIITLLDLCLSLSISLSLFLSLSLCLSHSVSLILSLTASLILSLSVSLLVPLYISLHNFPLTWTSSQKLTSAMVAPTTIQK